MDEAQMMYFDLLSKMLMILAVFTLFAVYFSYQRRRDNREIAEIEQIIDRLAKFMLDHKRGIIIEKTFKHARPMDFDQFEILAEMKIRRQAKRRARFMRHVEITAWCFIIPFGVGCLAYIVHSLIHRS
jgi:hypothetical protein